MGFIDELFKRKRTSDQEARATYRTLLAKGDAIKPAELAKLDQVAEAIGKTAEDVAADLEAMSEARALVAGMGDERQLIAASKASAKAISDHDASKAKLLAEFDAKARELAKARGVASSRMQAAGQARERLTMLHRLHPDVVSIDMVPQSPRDANGNLIP
ncbi:MAG: hypothetical protein K8S99_11505 [Planctomycetes bacterium]|nr:hypothetical protein [Planctomycetota bacterium]